MVYVTTVVISSLFMFFTTKGRKNAIYRFIEDDERTGKKTTKGAKTLSFGAGKEKKGFFAFLREKKGRIKPRRERVSKLSYIYNILSYLS